MLRAPLFLASTVSALHRNAHIWNASHPLLFTYYCRVTVYSPGMEAKKNRVAYVCLFRGSNPEHFGPSLTHLPSELFAQSFPMGRTVWTSQCQFDLNFKSQLFAEDRKIRLTPKISNHLFTCYVNCTCKSNPICLIQQ